MRNKNIISKFNHIKVLPLLAFTFMCFGTQFWLLFKDKININLFFSRHFSDFFDNFFLIITKLGEEWFLIPLGLFIIFKNKYLWKYFVFTNMFNILINISLKYLIFDEKRPFALYGHLLRDVPNSKELLENSFPSGHTSSAFLMAWMIIFSLNLKLWQNCIVFLLAILIGISRMYLQQHFLVDVYCGAILGFTSAFLGYMIYLNHVDNQR